MGALGLAAAVGVPLYAVVGAATAGLVHRLEDGLGGEIDGSLVLPGVLWPIMLPAFVAVFLVGCAANVFSPPLKRVALFASHIGSQKKG